MQPGEVAAGSRCHAASCGHMRGLCTRTARRPPRQHAHNGVRLQVKSDTLALTQFVLGHLANNASAHEQIGRKGRPTAGAQASALDTSGRRRNIHHRNHATSPGTASSGNSHRARHGDGSRCTGACHPPWRARHGANGTGQATPWACV